MRRQQPRHPPPRHLPSPPPPRSRKPPEGKPPESKPPESRPPGSSPPAPGRPGGRPTSKRRARSPRSTASPGDTGCHHRGGGAFAGALLAKQSPRCWHDQVRGPQDQDEDHLSGPRRVRPLFQGGRPHLPALQSATASDRRSLTGGGTSSKFLRRPCRLKA